MVRNWWSSDAFQTDSQSRDPPRSAGGPGAFDEEIPHFQTAAAVCSVGASRVLVEPASRLFPEGQADPLCWLLFFFFFCCFAWGQVTVPARSTCVTAALAWPQQPRWGPLFGDSSSITNVGWCPSVTQSIATWCRGC